MIRKPLSICFNNILFFRHSTIICNLHRLATCTDKRNRVFYKYENEKLYHYKQLVALSQIKTRSIDHNQVNGSDVCNTIIILSKIYKKIECDTNINKSVQFSTIIYDIINSYKHELQVHEIIQILHVVVDANEASLETSFFFMLKLIKNELINITANDYKELCIISSKLKSDRLRSAMDNHLQNILELKISIDLDRKNLDFLINAFSFDKNDVVKLNISVECLDKFNFENVSVNKLISLSNAFTHMEEFPIKSINTLRKVQNALIMNIEKIQTNDILSMLTNIYNAYQKQGFDFYNETLFNTFAKEIISRNVNITTAVKCLIMFVHMRYMNKGLLLFIDSNYMTLINNNNNPKILFRTTLNILISAAEYNCKLCHEKQIIDVINKFSCQLQLNLIIKVAFYLALLNHFNFNLLNYVFRHIEIKSTGDILKTLSLWQKTQIIKNYNGPTPTKSILQLFENKNRYCSFEILNDLENALGGSLYVKKKFKTKLHHSIDYITIFRKGGFPIAINHGHENKNYIEDLKVPTNCKIVGIIEVPETWYFHNSDELLGQYKMYFENLEALPIIVILLNVKKFKKLSTIEKLPYLMNIIMSNLDFDENSKFNNDYIVNFCK